MKQIGQKQIFQIEQLHCDNKVRNHNKWRRHDNYLCRYGNESRFWLWFYFLSFFFFFFAYLLSLAKLDPGMR